MPLSAYRDQTYFKLYMTDIGLLRRMARLPAAAILDNSSLYREFKGALTENYVLCELVNQYDDSPYYWKSGNRAEVDFIVQNHMDIVPIEVKSGRSERARSLSEYRKKYAPPKWLVTSMKNAGGSHIPLYMLWQIKKILNHR